MNKQDRNSNSVRKKTNVWQWVLIFALLALIVIGIVVLVIKLLQGSSETITDRDASRPKAAEESLDLTLNESSEEIDAISESTEVQKDSQTDSPDTSTGKWIGIWTSENGESIEVTEQHDDYILMTYHGYTAAGGMFTSYYTMYFDDESHLSAAEEESVLQEAGWRYRLVLEEDRIVMQSRYPDRYFYPTVESTD